MDEKKDKGLQGNEKIEEAILALQQEPTEELLAHALTVVRRRMREQGQFIVAVEPPSADVKEAVMKAAGTAMRLQAVQTSDGKKWWSAFTGFEEQLKGSGSVIPHGYRAAVSHDADRRRHRRRDPESLEPDIDVGQAASPYYSRRIIKKGESEHDRKL